MRIVIRDAERAASFLADRDILPALVAACAQEPRTVEGLLVATEPYAPGLTETVTHELMRFDQWIEGDARPARSRPQEAGSDLPMPTAFEVTGPNIRQLDYMPDRDGLVIIDLETYEILIPAGNISLPGRRGSVIRPDAGGEFEIETVYTLGPAWTLGSPEAEANVGAGHG